MRYLIIFEWSLFVMTSKSSRILSRKFGSRRLLIQQRKGTKVTFIPDEAILKLQIQK
jgi:hypothetical protein